MDWDTVLDIQWDWQVDFGLPYLTYFYTLHAKFGVSKPVIIIDTCVVKSWFTFENLQCVSLNLTKPKQIVFCIVFCIWMTGSSIHICKLKQHSMSTCRQNKHIETPSGNWKWYLKLWKLLLSLFVCEKIKLIFSH